MQGLPSAAFDGIQSCPAADRKLPVASSLRLPQAIQVTLPSRKRTGNRAPVAGNISFHSDIQFRRT